MWIWKNNKKKTLIIHSQFQIDDLILSHKWFYMLFLQFWFNHLVDLNLHHPRIRLKNLWLRDRTIHLLQRSDDLKARLFSGCDFGVGAVVCFLIFGFRFF